MASDAVANAAATAVGKPARSSSELEKCSDLERLLIEETKKELLQSFDTLDARCRLEGAAEPDERGASEPK